MRKIDADPACEISDDFEGLLVWCEWNSCSFILSPSVRHFKSNTALPLSSKNMSYLYPQHIKTKSLHIQMEKLFGILNQFFSVSGL